MGGFSCLRVLAEVLKLRTAGDKCSHILNRGARHSYPDMLR